MTPPIVVLDACILVSAALRDTLLRAAQAGFYDPRWSNIILEEVRRTLVNNQFTDEQRAQRLLVALRTTFPRAAVEGFEHRIGAMTNDPKDRHVLAAAVQAQAKWIITKNLRDFPSQALDPYGIIARSPDELLCEWQEFAPVTMLSLIRAQGAFLRSPRTPQEVIATLAEQGAPRFAGVALRYLTSQQDTWRRLSVPARN